MHLELWSGPLVLLVLVLGLGWPLAARLALAPTERYVAAVALALLVAFLLAWIVFAADWPPAALRVIPVVAAGGLWFSRHSLLAGFRDPDVRALAIAHLLVVAWCMGWLSLIASYSGGGWAGDWLEHWERARFFVEHWPADTRFIDAYPLTARPPLANVVTGLCLGVSDTTAHFASYQVVTTLLASLAFLPAALLARRWGGPGATASLAVLLLVSPAFVQNATFPWTKLPAAFFVLAALYFLLRARDPGPPPAAAPLGGALLGAALLTHYSAAPYALVFAAVWLGAGRSRWGERPWQQATVLAALTGAAVFAVWLGWAAARYGWHATFFSNTSALESAPAPAAQALRVLLNLRDTLVPFFLRDVNLEFLAQRSPWGWWRDMFFQCYQINVPLVLGSVGWLVVAGALVRAARAAAAPDRRFWAWLVAGTLVAGIASTGHRERWGLAHICLQPLLLLGLAFLAARWAELGRGWRRALVAGAAIDLALGIALHFGVQSFALDRWLAAGRPAADTLTSYSGPALLNLMEKISRRLSFVADVAAPPPALVATLLAVVFVLACGRARQRPPRPQ